MNLTKTYLPNKPDHSTFGGIVYESDFNGYNSASSIASRIESDWAFDRSCRKNIKQKEFIKARNKNEK